MRARTIVGGLAALCVCAVAGWAASGDAVRVAMAAREAAARDRLGHRLWVAERYADAALVFSDPHWRGLSYYRAYQYGRAFSDLGRVEGHLALYNTGVVYARVGLFAQARELFAAVLAERPEHPQALANIALMEELLTSVSEPAGDPTGEAMAAQGGDAPDEDATASEGEGGEGDARGEEAEAEGDDEPGGGSEEDAAPQTAAAPTTDRPARYDEDEILTSAGPAFVAARAADRAWLAQIEDRPGVFLRRMLAREKQRRAQAGEVASEGDDRW